MKGFEFSQRDFLNLMVVAAAIFLAYLIYKAIVA